MVNQSSKGNVMTRRGFLKGLAGILAAGVAPAILPSGILMPVRKLWVPPVETWTTGPDIIVADEWYYAMYLDSLRKIQVVDGRGILVRP